MAKGLSHFLQYNNAVPVMAILFMGSVSLAFAANDAARESLYSTHETVISIDNQYLLSADIDSFNFDVHITEIREDEDTFYVSYTYHTIEAQDYIWQNVLKIGEMRPSKKELLGKDLGLFVAEQLGQLVDGLKVSLHATQDEEKKYGVSQKLAKVEYSGLVGRVFDATTKEFPGYVPTVVPVTPEEAKEELALYLRNGTPYERTEKEVIADEVSEALSETRTEDPVPVAVAPTETPSSTPTGSPSVPDSDTTPPVLKLTGDEHITIEKGSSWRDPGATVTDNVNENLGVRVLGSQFDVNEVGDHEITYDATDSAGNKAVQLKRIVTVKEITVIVPPPIATTTPAEVPVATTTPVVETPPATTPPVVETPAQTQTPVVETPAQTPVVETQAETTGE